MIPCHCLYEYFCQAPLGSQVPHSLPPAQEATIKIKYRTQRQALEGQEVKTKQEAQQKKERIREKYQRDREVLAKQLQSVRDQFTQSRLALDQKMLQQNNFSEKHWILERAKRHLRAYHQVNFAAYLRRILFAASRACRPIVRKHHPSHRSNASIVRLRLHLSREYGDESKMSLLRYETGEIFSGAMITVE